MLNYDVQEHLKDLTPLSWDDIRTVASHTLGTHTVRDQGGTLRATYNGMQECVKVILLAAPMSYQSKADIAQDWSIDTNMYMAVLAECCD